MTQWKYIFFFNLFTVVDILVDDVNPLATWPVATHDACHFVEHYIYPELEQIVFSVNCILPLLVHLLLIFEINWIFTAPERQPIWTFWNVHWWRTNRSIGKTYCYLSKWVCDGRCDAHQTPDEWHVIACDSIIRVWRCNLRWHRTHNRIIDRRKYAKCMCSLYWHAHTHTPSPIDNTIMR